MRPHRVMSNLRVALLVTQICTSSRRWTEKFFFLQKVNGHKLSMGANFHQSKLPLESYRWNKLGLKAQRICLFASSVYQKKIVLFYSRAGSNPKIALNQLAIACSNAASQLHRLSLSLSLAYTNTKLSATRWK